MHRGEIHRRVMEILCAGSCRGNVRGMRRERAGKLVFLSSPLLPPFFSSRREPHLSAVVDATANSRIRGGYRLPSTPNIPIAVTSRYFPQIITADKDKKRNRVLDSGNVTSASRAYRNTAARVTAFRVARIPSRCLPEFFASDYCIFADNA